LGGRRRFEADVARQRDAATPLREQLLWRMEQLTSGQAFNLCEEVEHFPEVLDAFTLPGYETQLLAVDDEGKMACKGNLEDGGSLLITGFLHTPRPDFEKVATFRRELRLESGLAHHRLLEVEPPFRGRGLSLHFLHRSFAFYDELGLEEVLQQASLATGRWQWARVGFEFFPASECEELRKWTARVCRALGVRGLNVSNYSSAAQFARMGGNRKVSFEEMAQAMPRKRCDFAKLARKNCLAMEDQIELARAVMLSGPDWKSRLVLNGPSRVAFNIYKEAKEEQVAREQD
jgi:hypothetical protein